MRWGFGQGLIVAILVSLIFPILGIVSLVQGVSILLLLVGIWSVVFGTMLAGKSGELYYLGWGVVLIVLSSFSVLPIQYTAALLILALIALVLMTFRRKTG